MGSVILYGSTLVAAVVMTVYFFRTEKPARTAAKSMLSGIAALIIVHYFGRKAGLNIDINFFTCAASLIFGAPGVIIMALLH